MLKPSLSEVQTDKLDTTQEYLDSFESFPISAELLSGLKQLGYDKPTAVQAASIAAAIQGKDLLVQSQTGSGKTTAFGLPLLERLKPDQAAPHRPHGIVLCPTRELVQQVAAELTVLAEAKGIWLTSIYGGVPMDKQITALKSGVDIVIGTPGRLLDHVRRGNLSLEDIQIFVLDEADEMLSMGFWDDVQFLLQSTPKKRQTMLFSATLSYQVADVAGRFLKDPERIDVSAKQLSVSHIEHLVYHVQGHIPKPRQLLNMLEFVRPASAVIFCNTRHETELLAHFLSQLGFVAKALSGSLKQKNRDAVMQAIHSGELKYMVATDIAARGIDIADLACVVNYALPEYSEVYLHRVGRTARNGKSGQAISLVDGTALATLGQLERVFAIKLEEMTLPPEEEITRLRSVRMIKELSEKASVAELAQHLSVAQNIVETAEGTQIVAFLLKSYYGMQADSNHPQHHVASKRPGPQKRHQDKRATVQPAEAEVLEGNNQAAGTELDEQEQRRPRRRRKRSGPTHNKNYDHNGMTIVDAAEILGLVEPKPIRPIARPTRGSAANTQNNAPLVAPPEQLPVSDGLARIRVNIGFDDGFKGKGAVAKKISSLAGLNEGIVLEVEARRDHAILKAPVDIADMVVDRVDGAPLGKKVIAVQLVNSAHSK